MPVVKGTLLTLGPAVDVQAAVDDARRQMKSEFGDILRNHTDQAKRQLTMINDQLSVQEATCKEFKDHWEVAEKRNQTLQEQCTELRVVNKQTNNDFKTVMDQVSAQQGAAPPGAKPYDLPPLFTPHDASANTAAQSERSASMPPPTFGKELAAAGNGAVDPHRHDGTRPVNIKTRAEIFRASLLTGGVTEEQPFGSAVLDELARKAGRAPTFDRRALGRLYAQD